MMRVLVVASKNKGVFAPFIVEQTDALRKCGCEIEFFGIKGKSSIGYLGNLWALKRKIKEFHPSVIHAHYGLSGLFANLQRRVPVVTTYHGSDINDPKVLRFSKIAMQMSLWNIFVSRGILEKAKATKRTSLIPCGVTMEDCRLVDKVEARRTLRLLQDKKYVLFAGAFDNEVKNVSLARQSVSDLETELLELKGYSREEVNLLFCAVDVLLMTSFSEGSPQVIKEAMACGCPIVSVDVGDVKERLEGINGCYVIQSREPDELREKLQKAFLFEGRTEGRKHIIDEGLDNAVIARRIMEIYEKVKCDGDC